MPLTAKEILITPEMAQKWLAHPMTNRRLRESRVRKIAKDLEGGHWVLNGETIKRSKSGAVLDGQHRLQAIIRSNMPTPSLVVEGLPDEIFESLGQEAPRTVADVLGMEGCTYYTTVASTVRYLNEYDTTQQLSEV